MLIIKCLYTRSFAKKQSGSLGQIKKLAALYDWNERGEIIDGSKLCIGDSGSGFLQFDKEKNKFDLLGVYSLTTGLCGGGGEAVFATDVRHYLDWIRKTIASFP